MSIHFDASRDRFVVRWKQDGRRRIQRFRSEADAIAFDASLLRPIRPAPIAASVPSAAAGDGIYAYDTKAGVRFRFVFRQSDGSLSSRRGFTSRRSAAMARRRLAESIERGEVKVARETFGEFWIRLLEDRRPYLTTGSMLDLETHGRKRLLPAFDATPIARLDERAVRRWMAAMVERVEADEISAKTINNARTCLSVALNEACRRALMPRNPCASVPALPVHRMELDYLRLHEIEHYIASCSAHYLSLAKFLIGSGARISEALDPFRTPRPRPGCRADLRSARPRRRRRAAHEGQALPLGPARPRARRDPDRAARRSRRRPGRLGLSPPQPAARPVCRTHH